MDIKPGLTALSIFVAMVIVACGGGGSSGDGGTTTPPASSSSGGTNPPPSGTVLTKGLSAVLGDWLQNGCTVLSSTQSARNLIRATQVTASNHTHQQGVVTYANNSCSGTGTVVGPTQMGTVEIARSDADTSIAANWGSFKQITGLTSATIWAKKSETLLCLLGDETPSILPALSNVSSALATLPNSSCYTRQ